MIMTNIISGLIKLIPLTELIKERREYRSDCNLSEEVDSLILVMDNPKHMAEEHTNAYLLCKERIGTFNKVAKRLRKRGFNREADRVKEFVDRINSKDKAAVKGRNCLASARLHLISYKGLGPVFDVRIKLDSLERDFDSINQLRVR